MKDETYKVVLEKGDDLSPELGYDLLVYKDGRYIKTFKSGTKPKLSFLDQLRSNIEVFAVSNDVNLELSFRSHLLHTDGVHDFFLDFTVAYQIAEPKKLVEQWRRKPLKLVQDKIEQTIGAHVTYQGWERIIEQDSILHLKQQALEASSATGTNTMLPNLKRVQSYAANYGIQIKSIDFSRSIPEKFRKAKVALEDEKTDQTLDDIKRRKEIDDKNHEAQLKSIERAEIRRDNFARTLDTALDQAIQSISSDIRSIDQLKEAILASTDIQQMFKASYNDNGANDEADMAQVRQLTAGNPNSLRGILDEIIKRIGHLKIDFSEQRILMSCIFHLVAELLHQEEEGRLDVYIKRLDELDLTEEQKTYLTQTLKRLREAIEKEVQGNVENYEHGETALSEVNIQMVLDTMFLVPLDVNLPQKEIPLLVRERIQNAAGAFMEALGYELEAEDEPFFGSFFQTLWYKLKSSVTPEKAAQLADDGMEALRAQLNKTSAETTAALAGAAAELIMSLEHVDEAAIRLGTILVVKVTESGVPRVIVTEISMSLRHKLQEHPQFLRDPKAVMRFIEEKEVETLTPPVRQEKASGDPKP